MAEEKQAAYIAGYLSAIREVRRELREEWDVDEVLDRLEKVARRSAQKHGIDLTDESPIAGEDEDAAGKPDDFYDGGEQHSDVW